MQNVGLSKSASAHAVRVFLLSRSGGVILTAKQNCRLLCSDDFLQEH